MDIGDHTNVKYFAFPFCIFFFIENFQCFRNRSAEHLYGYSESEALGQDAMELLVDAHDLDVASNMINRITTGESWTGQFPVKNKLGERFLAVATNTPFYDDDGRLVGIICVSSDSRAFGEMGIPLTGMKPSGSEYTSNRSRGSSTSRAGVESQPLQVAIASKISNLVSFFLILGWTLIRIFHGAKLCGNSFLRSQH